MREERKDRMCAHMERFLFPPYTHTTPPNIGVPWGEAVFASLLTPPLEKKRTEVMAHVLVHVCLQHYTNSRFFSLFPPLYTISPPGAAGRELSSS